MVDVGNVLGVVAVTDLDAAVTWYERFFGRPPDRRPMEGDVEWQLTSNGGLQVIQSPEHAGKGFVTLGVNDIDATLQDLAARGVKGEAQHVGEIDGMPLRIAEFTDPAGNTVVVASQSGRRDARA